MKKLITLFAIAGMVLALAPAAQAGTIHEDDFSGAAGNLNGTGPGWIANTTTGWQLDGSSATSGSGIRFAWLPFAPTAGNVYTLSADVTTTGGSWLAIAFAKDSAPGVPPLDSTVLFTIDTYAWMLRKPGVNGQVQTFRGKGTANGGPSSTSAGNLSVVLDTQPALWTVEYFVGGSSIGAAVAYGTNPDISWVGFGQNNGAGTVDNFLLTDNSAPPAPGTLIYGK